MKESKARGIALLLLAIIFVSPLGLFIKWLPWHPVTISFYRFCIATVTLGFMLMVTKKTAKIHQQDTAAILVTGLSYMGANILFNYALAHLPLSVLINLFFTAPLHTLWISRIWLKEPLQPTAILAIVMGNCGVLMIAPPASFEKHPLAIAFSLLAGVLFGVMITGHRRLGPMYSGISIAFWQNLIAGAALLIPQFYFPVQFTGQSMALIGTVGILCTAFVMSCMAAAGKHLRAQQMGPVYYLEPMLTTLLAIWLIHERPAVILYIGSVLVIGAGLVSMLKSRISAPPMRN